MLNIGKTIQIRGNQSSQNIVCSINIKNFYLPENVMFAIILLGVNILAAKFLRELNLDLPKFGKYILPITNIIDFTGLLLKNKLIGKLCEYYLLNYKNLSSLAIDTHNQIINNRLREKYIPLLNFVRYWVKYEYIVNKPSKLLSSAITAYLDKLDADNIYEIWIFYKIIQLFEPIRQSKRHDHKLFVNSKELISIQYQAHQSIGWTLNKAGKTSSVGRRPDVLIKKDGEVKALIDAKYMLYSEPDKQSDLTGPDRNIVNQMIIYLDHIGPCDLGIVLFSDPVFHEDVTVDQGNRKIVFLNCYPYANNSTVSLDKVKGYIL